MHTEEERDNSYIRIRIILLGEQLSHMRVDISPFHDVDTFRSSEYTTLHQAILEHFVQDADIILVAVKSDMNLLKDVIYVLQQKEKLFVVITEKILDIAMDYNQLILEKQDDMLFSASASLSEKFKTTLHTLCNLMDNQIQTIRAHEYDFSSLVNLHSFFTTKGEVYLYPNLTQETIEAKLQTDTRFQLWLRSASEIWIKFFHSSSSGSDSEKCMELIENHMDEDANFLIERDGIYDQGLKYIVFDVVLKRKCSVSCLFYSKNTLNGNINHKLEGEKNE